MRIESSCSINAESDEKNYSHILYKVMISEQA
jgi:hypothetical protein